MHDRTGRDSEILATVSAPLSVQLIIGRGQFLHTTAVCANWLVVPAYLSQPCDATNLIWKHV